MTQGFVSVILLAGGSGRRMGTATPKQFLMLRGKSVARHSFDLFTSLPEVAEIIVVCAAEYQVAFSSPAQTTVSIRFATPGEQRQDSTYSGLLQVSPDISLVCVHDAARPLLTKDAVQEVIAQAVMHGAAALAVPAKSTMKQGCRNHFVERTLDRSTLWEMQTPQVIQKPLLLRAYAHCHANRLAVTDDVSLVETLGHPVKLVTGNYSNIKITTLEDFEFAKMVPYPRQNTRCGVYGVALKDNCLLLVHKDPNGVDAGKLDLPGGGIEFGENSEQALRREFREEVAMDFQSMMLWRNLSRLIEFQEAGGLMQYHHLGQIYRVNALSAIPGLLPEEFEWVPLSHLESVLLTPFAAEVAANIGKGFV